jgi:hypothetical protein
VVSIWDVSSEVRRSPYHPDESRWLNRASYLRDTRDPLGPAWADRYLIRGQPPMGSYVTGLQLLLQGRDLDTNGPWDFQFGFESSVTWNITRGNMPSQDDLLAVRRGSMVVAALTAVALFLIVNRLLNPIGGIAAGIFFIVNPLTQYLAALGTSDAVFTMFVSWSVLAALWLAIRPRWWLALLLGLAMAAGASTKLSPLGLAAGLGAYGLVLIIDPWLRRRGRLGQLWKLVSRRELGTERPVGVMLFVQPALVAALFVLSYPYLWSAPIERTRILFDFRRYEMNNQARIWPQAAIDTRFEALERTWINLNDRYSSTSRIAGAIGDVFGQDWSEARFDLFLAVPGILCLVLLAWHRGLASPHALVAVTAGGQSMVILTALGVDFNRYYLPLLFSAAIGVGVTVGLLAEYIQWGIQSFRSRASDRAGSQSPGRLEPMTAFHRQHRNVEG